VTSTRRVTWRRLRRDRLAIASGVFVVVLLVLVYAGPNVLGRFLGHGPNDPLPYAVDDNLKPVGPWTRVAAASTTIPGVPFGHVPARTKKTLLVLGGDGPLGRDELLRLLIGGRVSLEVAVGSTVLALVIGLFAGASAGYFGGWIDGVISRFADLVMAFPLLLLLVLVGSTVAPRFIDVTLGFLQPGVLALVVTIGLFTWFYPARIVRAEIASLKEREFVESARMVGAGEWRILRHHLLPHVVPVLLAYSAFLVATNVLLEAGITFLGVGVRLPTASWGNLLSTAWGTARTPSPFSSDQTTVWLTVFPSLMIFFTAVSWTLLGEGLRRALEPRQ
jgi:ABC-type dipeptide/oligopeptide/nickel transport system permease subunit